MRQERGKSKMQSKRSFDEKCWHLLTKIPRGKVTTYKAIAEALGTKAYRAVGMAMNRNPDAPRVPCHRVVASDGSLHGYAHGLRKKAEILRREGVETKSGKVVDFPRKLYRFPGRG